MFDSDFNFDEFDDYDEIEPFGTTFKTSPKCRLNINVSELVKIFGFRLISESPIKETGNCCVYIAEVPSYPNSTSDSNNEDNNTNNITQKYALKISNKKARIYKEFENYMMLPSSPFQVKSYDLFEFHDFVILQMELCEQDIYGVLLEERSLWKLIHDISNELNSIHSANLIHLDVSPSNILVKGNDFKLADFGNVIENGTFQTGDEGAGPYAAPEVLLFPGTKESGYVNVWSAADIFSFGVILLECASGFFAPRGSLMYEELRKGNLKLGQGKYKCDCSPEFISLVNEMLDPNPFKRPTSFQIMCHPCVAQFDKS